VENNTKKTLVIGCMDRRYNFVKEVDNENCVVIRNAGADIVNAEQSIIAALQQNPEITEIIFLPHQDCAAMKYVDGVASDGTEQNGLLAPLVGEFQDKEWEDIEELYRINSDDGFARLRDIVGRATEGTGRHIEVKRRYVGKRELDEQSEEAEGHSAVVIVEPFDGTNEDIAKRLGVEEGGMYVVQLLNADDVKQNAALLYELREKLHLEKVTLLEIGTDKKEYKKLADIAKKEFAADFPEIDFVQVPLKSAQSTRHRHVH
jgi:hypothetical protein